MARIPQACGDGLQLRETEKDGKRTVHGKQRLLVEATNDSADPHERDGDQVPALHFQAAVSATFSSHSSVSRSSGSQSLNFPLNASNALKG
jgi:hypothetical protein